MPELPEVETIRSGLADLLPGKRIAGVEVLLKKSLSVPESYITTHMAGAGVTDVRRRGKIMIVELSSGYSLLVHLKMTGQLVFEAGQQQPAKPETGTNQSHSCPNPTSGIGNGRRVAGGHPTQSMAGELPDKTTRVIFTFQDGSKLFFNDQRTFGWMKLVERWKVERDKCFTAMGVEPLGSQFEISHLKSRLKHRKAAIKTLLLDQSHVAGLGNIYVDEALHLAGVHPSREGRSLSDEEIERLHAAIIKVLGDSIQAGGTSFTSYVNANGVTGDYLHNARVYRRQGEPCRACGATIDKIKVGQRGTHICPNCQN